MGIAGNYFVTPHAIQQFQQRIAPLSYEQALAAILHSIENVPIKVTEAGQSIIRVRHGTYVFRAVVDDRQVTEEQPLPAIVTILKGRKK